MSSTWTNKQTQKKQTTLIRSVRISAFRAMDNPVMSKRFAEGHAAVLKNHGITKVTSMGNEWINDPNVYVMLITSLAGDKVYGGARIHCWADDHELPCQKVFRKHDDRTDEVFEALAAHGLGEFCALWTSVEISGLGLSAKDLVKVGWSLCGKLKLKNIVALLSPVTKRWMKELGLEHFTELAGNGEIPYPTDRFIATLTNYRHPEGRTIMGNEFLEDVLALERNPHLKQEVSGIRGKTTVHYDLLINVSTP